MKTQLGRLLVLGVLLGGLFSSTGFAATVATAAVTPAVTVAGVKVFIHTAVSNMTVSNQAVTVTLNVANPGTLCDRTSTVACRSIRVWSQVQRTRLAELSLDIPPSACSGTYS